MSQRKHPLAVCEKCPFKNRSVAYTTGPEDAKVAVVSRSPGHYEALSGKSFTGPSGKVLDHLLATHGVSRDEVLATNVVLCQSDGQESGFALAQACCETRLDSELSVADTVIACGSEAVYGVLGASNIAQNRGYVHFRQIADGPEGAHTRLQRVIVTNNPAVVLRDDANYPELVRDFRLALDPLPEPKMPTVRVIDNAREAKDAVEDMIAVMSEHGMVACDIETRGVDGKDGLAHTAEVVCAGFSVRTERAVVFGEQVPL